LKPTPTDNIIATTEQIEQMAGQTTNAIIGGFSVIGAAIGVEFCQEPDG
jgi:hypothetical protein